MKQSEDIKSQVDKFITATSHSWYTFLMYFYLCFGQKKKKNLFNQKQKFSEAKSLFQLTDSSLSLGEVRAETQARTG